MKQIIEESELVGKTIEKQGYTDNTFALFRGCGWEERDVELMYDDFNLVPSISNCYKLKTLGFISEAKYKKVIDDHNAKEKLNDAKREKKLYKKLKKKYEP